MGKALDQKHKEMMNGDPEYARAYADMEHEFDFARELIKARIRAGLTQQQIAEKMGTTQSTVARLESGGYMPSLRSLHRYAQATGSKVKIILEA
ncbi:helix-turn-helix domain-containing protein [Desulfonatronovibrio magnus]|uniref:helix-turn-helix domain-containing protein n=1 Tax=Desulfonatronovibrio magnus TaxID=698827 RepID=UPI000695F2B8|nr:helix-turn-helix transcriptional regulator [Desulfonatronovibrio magnus]